MPRKLSNALTPLAVKSAKAGRHADGGGLHLLVKESGARSWVYRFMLRGQAHDVGLGAASGPEAISLAKARDKADALRLKVKSGIDPLAERDREAAEALAAAQAAQTAGITFKAVADAHIAANEPSWRNAKHRQQWSNTLSTYACQKPRVAKRARTSLDVAVGGRVSNDNMALGRKISAWALGVSIIALIVSAVALLVRDPN